jgi:hypothetical protein
VLVQERITPVCDAPVEGLPLVLDPVGGSVGAAGAIDDLLRSVKAA